MWWLAWMPVKMIYRTVTSVIGVATVASTTSALVSSGTQVATASASAPAPAGTDTATVVMEGKDAPVVATAQETDEDSVLETINNIVKEDPDGVHDDGERNPKKRMWEEPVARRDEL
jgi:hypothetical protein